jgi:hypothetical protein
MPNYSGVWSLPTVMQAVAQGNWTNPATPIGIYAGGLGGYSADIQSIIISSLGNSTDFGDLFLGVSNQPGAASSTVRYLYAGGFDGSSHTNVIQYGDYTGGTGSDFGDTAVTGGAGMAGLSNNTRALFGGGQNSITTIEYVTIASTGNATDFGDAVVDDVHDARGVASSTRGVFLGAVNSNVIQYVTIATTGNTTDFGDMTQTVSQGGACSNATRGLYAGGWIGTTTNVIEYITLASTGNATDFGDLLSADRYNDAVCDSTRAVFIGFAGTDQTEYVTIASTGNALEFGDLTGNRVQIGAGTSNTHGGLS